MMMMMMMMLKLIHADRILTTDSVTSLHHTHSASARAALHGEQIVWWADDRRGKNRHATAASTDVERERQRIGRIFRVSSILRCSAGSRRRRRRGPDTACADVYSTPARAPPPPRDQYSTKRDRYFQTVPGTAIRYVGHLNFGLSRV